MKLTLNEKLDLEIAKFTFKWNYPPKAILYNEEDLNKIFDNPFHKPKSIKGNLFYKGILVLKSVFISKGLFEIL